MIRHMSRLSYELEMEALASVGAEIVESPAKTEDEFIGEAKDADALPIQRSAP